MARSNQRVADRPDPARESPAGLPWPAYLVLFILLLSGIYAWNLHRYQFDDAYISYRYARNVEAGNGPVFNVGDRVEGYSNFLWVLLLAGGAWMKIPPPVLAPLLGVLSYLAILAVCWCVTWIGIRDWGIGQRAIASVLLFSLVLCHGLAVTAGSGLETHFYAALILSALTISIVIDRRPRLLVPAPVPRAPPFLRLQPKLPEKRARGGDSAGRRRCVRALVISKKEGFRRMICERPGLFPVIGKEVCLP